MAETLTSLTLDEALARAGPAADTFAQLWRHLWAQPQLPDGLLELCRLTIARLHRDPVEQAALNPLAGQRADLPALRELVLADKAHESDAFTAGEKAVLLYAEYYWMDTSSIPDEASDAVKAQYGDAGLVLLIEALGVIDGRVRTARCLRGIAAHRNHQEELAHVQ